MKVRRSERYSLEITIPRDLVSHLNIKEGDRLTVYTDPNDNRYGVIIKGIEVDLSSLGTVQLMFPEVQNDLSEKGSRKTRRQEVKNIESQKRNK